MKIPKYIEYALRRRAKNALDLMHNDEIVSRFIDEHNIEVSAEDYRTGVEMYANPDTSADRIRQAILDHEDC